MLSIWWKVKENGNDVMLPNREILWDTSRFRWDKISLSILLQEVRKGLDFIIIWNLPLKSFQGNSKKHSQRYSLYHQSLFKIWGFSYYMLWSHMFGTFFHYLCRHSKHYFKKLVYYYNLTCTSFNYSTKIIKEYV